MSITCRYKMKRGGHCTMQLGHKGHTTVSFVCDSCGNTRRGNGRRFDSADDTLVICFMCERGIN